MSQINSLSSFQYEYADPALEFPFRSDADPVLLPITNPPSTDALVEQQPATISEDLAVQTESLTTTGVLSVGPLHDVPTTQSLIAALQSTMTPTVTRSPVVIPGSRRREQTKKQLVAGPVRHMSPRLRLAIVLGVIVVIVITALVSLTPLGGGQGSPSLVGSAVEWMQTQQQSDNISGHVLVTLAQANPVPTTSPAVTTAAALPPVTLSTSAYVNIARQDALANGINPDYFVRQIQLESGFNPGAYSPAGAVGIAQFEPGTAAALGVNPYDPVSALAGAARYMAGFARQYGGDYAKALAAYNAGSGTVQYAVAAGGANWMSFLPGETQQYILRIIG